MKKTLILSSFILLISCNKDAEFVQNTNQVSINSLKYIASEDYGNFNDIHSQEYTFDVNGKVLSETFTNIANPQYNYTSTFEYNSQGKLITEIKNSQVFRHIIWNGNFAELYNNQNQKISDFTFNNDNLIEYNSGFINGNIENHRYNYDITNNVVSEEKQNVVFVEYLNYDTSLANPMNLIKSIGILRLYYKPYFKNFFETEKAYPYNGIDYMFPLTYYGYQKTVDANNRINSITDDKTLIYITKFEYN
jgi:opacity protein-like surface antigen